MSCIEWYSSLLDNIDIMITQNDALFVSLL